jgi:hypothetical protein
MVAVKTIRDIVMSKTKAVATIAEAARTAGTKLALWDAIEAEAKNHLEAAEARKDGALSDSFAEIHFCGSSVQGVVKVRDFVLKVSN